MLILSGSSQWPLDTSCKSSSLTGFSWLLCFLDIQPDAQNILKKQSLDLNP